MATTAPTWTVTLRAADRRRGSEQDKAEPRSLGVTICPYTNAITRITKGVFAWLNKDTPGSVELGDRIIEVEGKAGRAQDLLSARLVDGELKANLRVKLLRPLLVQPVVIPMRPGEPLGIDIGLASTNVILGIDAGRVADLNKVLPGTIEVGDRILEVDGKTGNAVEQIRAWVKDNKATPRDLRLTIARRAFSFRQMLLRGDFKEMSEPNSASDKPTSAWRYSVMVSLGAGESLGVGIDIDFNTIVEVEDEGAIANLNKAHPRSIQVGDRILSVDEVRCPYMASTAELESWFRARKLDSNGAPRDIRLTVLRPVERAGEGTILPPCGEDERCVDSQSTCTSSTTVSRSVSEIGLLGPAAAGLTLPSVKESPRPVRGLAEALEDLRKRGRATTAWMS